MAWKLLGATVTIQAASMVSNGVILSFSCAISLVGATDICYVNDTV
jgi:hypothetical protein